ncbi:MAG: hypothetical protein ABI451_12930 [Dokdonella sp.]
MKTGSIVLWKRARRVGLALGLAISSVAIAGGNILVSEVTGISPGAGLGPIPVKFTRKASEPVFSFKIRILFDPTMMLAVSANGINGGECAVDDTGHYVVMQMTTSPLDIPTDFYCQISVDAIAGGIPTLTELLLVPVDSGVDFTDGGCFDASLQLSPCMLMGGGVLISITDLIQRSGFDH